MKVKRRDFKSTTYYFGGQNRPFPSPHVALQPFQTVRKRTRVSFCHSSDGFRCITVFFTELAFQSANFHWGHASYSVVRLLWRKWAAGRTSWSRWSQWIVHRATVLRKEAVCVWGVVFTTLSLRYIKATAYKDCIAARWRQSYIYLLW